MSTNLQTTPATWQIDPVHSNVGFVVRHLMVTNVKGEFGAFEVELDYDESDVTASSVRVEIDANSINTRNEMRDNHLRSADFFDAENFPKVVFESREVRRLRGDRLEIVGDLTIRGVTREITLEAELLGQSKDPWGGERLGFSAHTRINRKDWGLEWNQVLETGGVTVANEVKLEIEAQFKR